MTEEASTETKKYGVTVLLQPQNRTEHLLKAKSVRTVLNRLDLRQSTVLVIRDGQLLTPDRKLYNGDELIIRTVVSSG